MTYKNLSVVVAIACLGCAIVWAEQTDTLPPLEGETPPQNFSEMWAGFDACAEPLEVETLHEWEEDEVLLRVVRFRIGVFKGKKATLAAIYGFPKRLADSDERVPGLVQIHGGGQYADHRACLTNAKRGYATVSIAWAGRISAPDYRLTPKEVQLFWDGKTDDPAYKLTTDWGAVDGYHAPGRNAGNSFPSAAAADWTLDSVESPRNSGWFLCALAARRAITFLEQQPEVDKDRIGVYGHSMGGKLTVMAAVDERVKAAAPSCGGISDRYNRSPLFRATVGDDVSLKQVSCPIIFLNPANDFHGRIGDLPSSLREIKSQTWRTTSSPHGSHQDKPQYEVATQLWFDEHLKGTFAFPETPATALRLDTDDHTPTFTVTPDPSKTIVSVHVFYTQQGKPGETPAERENTMHRFWHHSAPAESGDGRWTAKLPIADAEKPLWVYANVGYSLESPITGAGYYYGIYTANTFNLSSILHTVTAAELSAAKVRPTLKPSQMIEDFSDGWEKGWFHYDSDDDANRWARTTNKLHDQLYKAPEDATLAIEVRAEESNVLVMMLDGWAAEIKLEGGDAWQAVVLSPGDFTDAEGKPLSGFGNIMQLKLSPSERLRPARGSDAKPRRVGGAWKGASPQFRNLRWVK